MSAADEASCWISRSRELWQTDTLTDSGSLCEAGWLAVYGESTSCDPLAVIGLSHHPRQMICPSTHTTTGRSLPLPPFHKQIWQTIVLCLPHMSFINADGVGEQVDSNRDRPEQRCDLCPGSRPQNMSFFHISQPFLRKTKQKHNLLNLSSIMIIAIFFMMFCAGYMYYFILFIHFVRA